MGVFNAALQWQGAIQFLAGVLCTAAIPVMAEKIGAGEAHAGVCVMKGMMKGVAILALPVGLILCACSSFIMRCYGPAFSHGALTMCLLVATGFLMSLMTPVASYLSASGLMWAGFVINLGWVVSMVFGAWFLVRWGAQGLALSRLLATTIHSAIVCVYVIGLISQMKRSKVSVTI
jgi:O-antigen/teichoic acid export membrane protein